MSLDWSIIRENGPIDFAGNFARGYKLADDVITGIRQKQALGHLAENPDDRNALANLYRVNPELGARMETMNMKRHEVAREADARNALAKVVGRIGGSQFPDFRPQPNAITGQMPEPVIDAPVAGPPVEPAVQSPVVRDTPGTAINAPSMTGDPAPGPDGPPPATNEDEIVVTGQRTHPPEAVTPDNSADWEAYVNADPEGGMKMLIDRHKLNHDQALALGAQMEVIGRLASTVTDQASLDKAIAWAEGMGLDTSRVPREYTPEAIENVKYQAMTAKEAIKTKHDITDDEIDNARADAALKLRERIASQASADRRRGQDMTDSRGRRGQDISHEDRVRGQDMTDARGRRGQDMRGSKGGKGGNLPRVKSVAEARALPPGTMFIDPSGNVRKR